jgi:long-chain fatty acid transport protein
MFPGRHSNINAALVYPKASYNLLQSSLPEALADPGRRARRRHRVRAVVEQRLADHRSAVARLHLGRALGPALEDDNFNNAAQVYGRSSKVRSYNIAPTMGYQITDWLSVGAALQLQYFKVELKQAFGVPAAAAVLPNAPSSMIRADDFEAGYKFGAAVTPWAGRQHRPVLPLGDAPRRHGRPEAAGPGAAGARHRQEPDRGQGPPPRIRAVRRLAGADPQWQVHAGVEWTNWSRLRRVPIFGRITGAQVASLNFEYDDAWYFSAGAEYAFSPNLTLRAGVSYEDSAVSDRVRNVRIFDNDRLGVSAGARLQMEREAHARPVLRALLHQGRAGRSLARQPLLCGRGLCRRGEALGRCRGARHHLPLGHPGARRARAGDPQILSGWRFTPRRLSASERCRARPQGPRRVRTTPSHADKR